jgi:hypothetical protein
VNDADLSAIASHTTQLDRTISIKELATAGSLSPSDLPAGFGAQPTAGTSNHLVFARAIVVMLEMRPICDGVFPLVVGHV